MLGPIGDLGCFGKINVLSVTSAIITMTTKKNTSATGPPRSVFDVTNRKRSRRQKKNIDEIVQYNPSEKSQFIRSWLR